MTHHRAVTGAVLLAAGRGRRLRPYTDTTPKPLLPVAGRPTLDLYSEGLKSAAVSDVVLVAHHLADQIEAYGQQLQSRYDLRCVLVQQPQLDGTASALEAVWNRISVRGGKQQHCSGGASGVSGPVFIDGYRLSNPIAFHRRSIDLSRIPQCGYFY